MAETRREMTEEEVAAHQRNLEQQAETSAPKLESADDAKDKPKGKKKK